MEKALVSRLRENYLLNCTVLFATVFVFVGRPVPSSNEFSYLLRLFATYSSEYFVNDPTFSGPQNEHWLFNHIFGLFTIFLSIEIIGWLGRFVCWGSIIVLLIRLGRRWEIPLWQVSAAIFLWLSLGQSIVNDEWILGGFEAKVVAYIFLLLALNGFCDRRDIFSAAYLGLAFSFHPLVGLWGTAAAILAVSVSQRDFLLTTKIAAVAAIFSLPGLIPLLIMKANGAQAAVDNLQYLELVKFPHHFDPFSWAKSSILLLIPLTVFSIAVHLYTRRNGPPNFLPLFLAALAAFFTVGIPLRFFDQFALMEFMPMRLFPVFAPLFFLFYLGRSYQFGLLKKPVIVGILVPTLILSVWTKLPIRAYEQARATYYGWTKMKDDTAESFIWLGNNSATDAVVIAPPWRYDFWYLSRRSKIVSYRQPIYSNLGEWQTRLDKLIGPANSESGIREESELKEFYFGLSKQDIMVMSAEYNADYLISETDYPFPVSFSKGKIKIYRLR